MTQRSREECPGARLRALVTERHAAFVQEIWALFSGTVTRLEEEVRALRAENDRHRRRLEETGSEKTRQRRKTKAHRTALKKQDSRPDVIVEIVTENSSDSDNEMKKNAAPKGEEIEGVVCLEPESEVQTEDSSEDEPRQGRNEKPQKDAAQIKDEPGRGRSEKPQEDTAYLDPENDVVLSEPLTENSSDMDSEPDEKKPTSVKKSGNAKKKEAFVCGVCSKSFNFKSVWKMHMRSHGDNQRFDCSECGSSFVMKYHLDRHMEIHCWNRPSGSQDESKILSSLDFAPETENAVADVDNMPELKCTSDFDAEIDSTAVPHKDNMPELEPASTEEAGTVDLVHLSKRPQCFHCGKTFSTTGNMRRHIHNMHEKSSLLSKMQQMSQPCSVCERRFRFKSELQRHMKREHANQADQANAEEVNATQANANQMNGKQANARKGYECYFCQKLFRDKNYLQEHVRVHTGKKPYRCMVCGKCFTFRKSHNAHMKIHETLPSPVTTGYT